MEIMTNLLEENNIDLPDFARRWERKEGSGNLEHALILWVKPISNISVSDGFVSDLPYYISKYEASIPSLEETPVSSPKLPPKTSHFLVVFYESSKRSFPIQSNIYHYDYECDI